MATVKSLNTILGELKTFVRAYNRAIDTGDTSLAKDLLLTPYSVGGQAIFTQVGIARDLHILSKLTGDDLANEGTNYQLEHLQGTFAVVTLTFYSSTLPGADITIPAGTQCRTTGTAFASPVLFSVIADNVFPVASMAAYYSYDRARYELPVSAIASKIGTDGNIGAGSINAILGSVVGVNGVTNLTASSGGSGVEDDEDFKKRIALKMTGRDLNTVNGLREYTRASGFPDSYAIRVEDPLAERADGVDIFVVDNYSAAVTDTFTYSGATDRYYLTKSPVKDVTSVISAAVGPLAEGVGYDVHIDNITPLRRSIHAEDWVEIRAAASLPPGDTFTVTYTYSQTIANYQNTLAQDTNRVLTANVLVKRAFPLYLYINATLTLLANADGPTTRNKVRNALSQFMATFRMGDDVHKSDLIIVMQQGYGEFPVNTVTATTVNSYYLQDEFGVNYLPVDDVITVGNTQYAVYGAATIL